MLYKEGKPLYDALPDKEKQRFEDQTKKAIAEWKETMQEWKDEQKLKGGDEQTKTAKKDASGMPKRPLGAFPQWIADNRKMLTEKIMKEHAVKKSKVFLMLYKEAKPVYEALTAAEKNKCEDQAKAAKEKFQAEVKEWKEKSKMQAVKAGA